MSDVGLVPSKACKLAVGIEAMDKVPIGASGLIAPVRRITVAIKYNAYQHGYVQGFR
jgi:hypothetical protein